MHEDTSTSEEDFANEVKSG